MNPSALQQFDPGSNPGEVKPLPYPNPLRFGPDAYRSEGAFLPILRKSSFCHERNAVSFVSNNVTWWWLVLFCWAITSSMRKSCRGFETWSAFLVLFSVPESARSTAQPKYGSVMTSAVDSGPRCAQVRPSSTQLPSARGTHSTTRLRGAV